MNPKIKVMWLFSIFLFTSIFLAVPVQIASADVLEAESEVLVHTGWSDPVALFDSATKKYYLSGTGTPLRILQSDDGVIFTPYKIFDPSLLDSEFDYCNMWAPDLKKRPNGTFYLSFTASRVLKGEACGSIDNVTIFQTSASDATFDFKPAAPFSYRGPGYASSSPHPGCINGCCELTMRIDSNLIIDPVTTQEEMFYVWFNRGNNIASFTVGARDQVTSRAEFSLASDEYVNEAPDVFKHDKYYYMIYSHGSFNMSYGLSYAYSESLATLKKSPANKAIFSPVFDTSKRGCAGYSGYNILAAGGHSSTIDADGITYIYYHKNRYSVGADGCNTLAGRDTYRRQLIFLPNGQILPFDQKI